MTNEERDATQCPECHAYMDWHFSYCSRVTVDQLRKDLRTTQELLKHNNTAHDIQNHRLKERLTFWQGKFHAVRHENNKLRRRMKQQFIKDAAVLDDEEIAALIAGLEDVLAGRLTAIPPRVRRALEGLGEMGEEEI